MWIRSLCSTDPIRYANAVSMSVTIWDLRMLSTFLASNFAEKEELAEFKRQLDLVIVALARSALRQ
jgi:hypothetical protein